MNATNNDSYNTTITIAFFMVLSVLLFYCLFLFIKCNAWLNKRQRVIAIHNM